MERRSVNFSTNSRYSLSVQPDSSIKPRSSERPIGSVRESPDNCSSDDEFAISDAQRAQLFSQSTERSALHDAASLGRNQEVESLVRSGAGLEKVDAFGRTPLFLAALLGHEAVVRTCTQMGAKLDTRDITGASPIHVAAAKGHEAVIDVLFDMRADIDMKCNFEKTPLHHAVAGMQADTCRRIIQLSCNTEAKSPGVPTPLMAAVLSGFTLELEALIEAKCDMHGVDEEGSTPLHVSACKERLEVLETLMENGARAESTDKWGMMPIHRASRAGEHEAVQRLVELKASVSSRALGTRQTALHFAAIADELPTIGVLVRQKAILDSQDVRGYTPLHAAVEAFRPKALAELLSCGAPSGKATKAGDSALHLAVQNNSVELVQCLMEYACNVNVRGRHRRTALHVAAELGLMEVAEVLLGSNPMLQRDTAGPGADNASGGADLFQRTISASSSATPEGGNSIADSNARDDKKQSPLHLAAWNGRADMVTLMSKYGAHIDIIDAHGCTPLAHAVRQDFVDAVLTLVGLQADPLYRNEQHLMPLQQACMCGSFSVARFLNEMRMIPPHDEVQWRRPMALASFYGHTEIAAYFSKPVPQHRLALHMPRGRSFGVAVTPMSIHCEPPVTMCALEVVRIGEINSENPPTVEQLLELFNAATEKDSFEVRKLLQENEWLDGLAVSVEGLMPETTYALRLVATNDEGTTIGDAVLVDTKSVAAELNNR